MARQFKLSPQDEQDVIKYALSRRDFLKLAGLFAGGPLLNARRPFSGTPTTSASNGLQLVEAKQLVYSAWDQNFLLGEQPVNLMKDMSLRVEDLQKASQ